MKLLLYCHKGKPYIRKDNKHIFWTYTNKQLDFPNTILNGKIVAECDFEVEEITYAPNPSAFDRANFSPKEWGYDYQEKYGGLSNEELLKHSCLTNKELSDYLNTPANEKKVFCKDTFGYAIHINNLHVFDKPRKLKYYSKRIGKDFQVLGNAPQNMMRCCELKYVIEDYILTSVSPQEMCRIANKEQTVLVRRNVLKECLE